MVTAQSTIKKQSVRTPRKEQITLEGIYQLPDEKKEPLIPKYDSEMPKEQRLQAYQARKAALRGELETRKVKLNEEEQKVWDDINSHTKASERSLRQGETIGYEHLAKDEGEKGDRHLLRSLGFHLLWGSMLEGAGFTLFHYSNQVAAFFKNLY